MRDVRGLRGLIRTGLTAGVVLSVIATGSLLVAIAAGLAPHGIYTSREIIAVATRGFIGGALAGGLFSWLIRGTQRGKSVGSLSVKHVALFGAAAAATIPLLSAAMFPAISIGVLAAGTLAFGVGGAAISAGMLRIAQRAPEPHAELDAANSPQLR